MSPKTDCSIHHLLPFPNWTWHPSSNWQLPPLPKPLEKHRFLPPPDTMTDFKSLQHLLSISASYHMPDRSCNFGRLLSSLPDSKWQKHWKHRQRHLIDTKTRRVPIQAGITYSRISSNSLQARTFSFRKNKETTQQLSYELGYNRRQVPHVRQTRCLKVQCFSSPVKATGKTYDASVCRGLSISLSIIRGSPPLTFLFSSLLILAGVSDWTDRHCCVELKLQSHCSLNLDRKHSERRLHLQGNSKKPCERPEQQFVFGFQADPSCLKPCQSWGSCHTSHSSPSLPPPPIIGWAVVKL